MKISQTHRMKSYFWFALPIVLVIWGILFYNNKENPSTFLTVELIPPVISIVLILGLLWSVKLQWELDPDHFTFSFKPFIWKRKSYPTNEIETIEICKIKPLLDFGGWGLRYSTKFGNAYTTHGNTVLRIHLKNYKILNFTTENTPELTELIDSLSKKTQD
ncbi:MAG: hypothetical protein NBV77_03350 [Bacteroidia bacterium]|nr:hypothetical protein [Bacteroidia bacterium]